MKSCTELEEHRVGGPPIHRPMVLCATVAERGGGRGGEEGGVVIAAEANFFFSLSHFIPLVVGKTMF